MIIEADKLDIRAFKNAILEDLFAFSREERQAKLERWVFGFCLSVE